MSILLKSKRKSQFMILLIPVILVFLAILAEPINSTPPEYQSFRRDQVAEYSPLVSDLMRIWIVNVGQGDGILIQLPNKYNYHASLNENSDEESEQIDILIDGGSFKRNNSKRMLDFLRSIYPQSDPIIEHTVITHHDSDHILGFTNILKETTIAVENIFHNGLASYLPKEEIFGTALNLSSTIRKSNRVMARQDSDSGTLKEADLIEDLDKLKQRYRNKDLQGIYKSLAKAIIEKDEPQNILKFDRVWEEAGFIKETEAAKGIDLDDLELKVIWPQKNLKAYKKNDWGKYDKR